MSRHSGGPFTSVRRGCILNKIRGAQMNTGIPRSSRRDFSRRLFLQSGTAALAERLFAAPAGSSKPNPELESLGAAALSEAKKQHASYADIRIIRYRRQAVGVTLNPERGSGKTLEVPSITDGGSFGFGVRVIVNGCWGF